MFLCKQTAKRKLQSLILVFHNFSSFFRNHHNRRSFLIDSSTSSTTTSIPITSTEVLPITESIPWTDKQIIEDLLKKYRFPGI